MVRTIFNPMVRAMRTNESAVGYGSFETPIRHKDTGAILRGCDFMSAMSQGYGCTKARSNSGDSTDDNFDPFGVPSEPMIFPEGCDHEADKRWYLQGRIDKMRELFEKYEPGQI